MMGSDDEEAEFDDGSVTEKKDFEQKRMDVQSSDDEPISSLKDIPEVTRKRSAAKAAPSYAEEVDEVEESSDDDMPLSSLAKIPSVQVTNSAKAKTTKKKVPPTKKKKVKDSPMKKKSTTAKSPPPKQKSSTNTTNGGSNKKYEQVSAALYGSDTIKGLLIQRLLCRWWYAYSWPDPDHLPKQIPEYHDALDGFPGVYICTSGANVGQIKDFRNLNEAPTFQNFSRKSSSELRDMLTSALLAQREQLVAAEGMGTTTEKELQSIIKWAQHLKTEKADKDAAKVLKAQGMHLTLN